MAPTIFGGWAASVWRTGIEPMKSLTEAGVVVAVPPPGTPGGGTTNGTGAAAARSSAGGFGHPCSRTAVALSSSKIDLLFIAIDPYGLRRPVPSRSDPRHGRGSRTPRRAFVLSGDTPVL